MRRASFPFILLVEDDDIDAMHMERMFRKHAIPAPLARAIDAQQALEILKPKDGDDSASLMPLVLLDINLPATSGLALLRHLRQDPALATIVVMIISTSLLESDIREAYRLNVAGYFVKEPGTEHQGFFTMLREYLDSAVVPSA